jgi:hypothetical protein
VLVQVTLGVRRFRPLLPGIEAAAGHAQTAAQERERVVRLLRRDEPKLHRRSFAKKAAAFLRTPALPAESGFLSADGRAPHARPSSARSCHGAIGARAIDPLAKGCLGQIEVARHTAHAPALVEHEPDRLGLEVVIESPAGPALGGLCHRSGHPIRLSEDVHQTGSNASASVFAHAREPRGPAGAGRQERVSNSARALRHHAFHQARSPAHVCVLADDEGASLRGSRSSSAIADCG